MKATEIILDLKTAQQAIASNWIEAYKKYVSPDPPSSRLASPAADFQHLNGREFGTREKAMVEILAAFEPLHPSSRNGHHLV